MSEHQDKERKSDINITFDMLRVTPTPPEREVNDKNDRLTDFIFIIFIFGIAYWFRFLIYIVFTQTYGNVFAIRIPENDPFGFGAFLGVSPGERINSDGYGDFVAYYIPYVNAFEDGWNPYSGSRIEGDNINGYVYGPYYMYSIAIGKLVFGLNTVDSIVFSNIILDALTYVMVYVLAKRVTGNVIAFIFALVGSFSPISLFFIAFKNLNAPIMNLVFLLFIYCYLEKRDSFALFFLALGILTKQFPLFMAMPVGLWLVRRYGFMKGVGLYLRFFAFILLLSIPYILWTPRSYIIRLFLPGGSKSEVSCPNGPEATNLFHGTIPLEACIVQGDQYVGIDTSMLPFGYDVFFFLVNYHVLFFISIIILAYIGFTAYDYLEEQPKLYYVYFAAYYGIVHATIARGIYKYYLTFLVPLFILGFVVGNRKKSLHVRLGYMLKEGWSTWINPKYRQKEVTLNYILYTIALILTTIGVFWLVIGATEFISFNNDNQGLFILIFCLITVYTIIKPSNPIENSIENQNVTSSEYSKQIAIYTLIIALGVYFSKTVADYYFNSDSDYNLNLLIIIGLFVLIAIIPILKAKVTQNNNFESPFTLHLQQFFIDTIGIIVVYFILVFFHVQAFLIFRFYITLFILLFSFIFLGMLGNQVWTSGIRTPQNFIREYRRIRSAERGESNPFYPI